MNKIKLLNRINKLYKDDNINIIKYLKDIYNKKNNLLEDIMISYDFQAGSYVEKFNKNKNFSYNYVKKLANIINSLECNKTSIFEGGVGEATTLVPLIENLKDNFKWVGGNDIAYSRIKIAQLFCGEHLKKNINLFMGDLFNIPIKDNSIDVVYTSHSLEPNGGKEKELLEELYRITRGYLILLEPAYEFANEEAKTRMISHGYVTRLYETAKKMNLNIISYELYGINSNDLNPTGIMIIKKNIDNDYIEDPICCPITHTNLEKLGNCYYSNDSMLAYPIINRVPCLTKDNAIVATKMKQFMLKEDEMLI